MMLHILWLAIKFIGILLAFLLAFLLLAAALVLFCPLRYRAAIRKSEKDWTAHGKAGWLFGLVSVTVCLGSESETDMELRICGAGLSSWKRFFSRKKRNRKKKSKQVKQLEQQRDASSVDARKNSTVQEALPSYQETAKPEKIQQKEPVSKENVRHAEGKTDTQKPNLIRRLWIRIAGMGKNIWESIKRFFAAVRKMCRKLSAYRAFLEDPHTGDAFRLTWQQLLRLLRHAGPQKWEGFLTLGLENPAATGQILAVLGAAYPIHQGHISVTPVWDREVLEGNARVKGRIYGVMLLHMAGKIFFDKNVKYVINWFRRQASTSLHE